MKTNESVILAHGWEKIKNEWGDPDSPYYFKIINNWEIFIGLNKMDGDYWLSLDDFPNDVETYVAIAEELKLLNVEPNHKIIKLKERI